MQPAGPAPMMATSTKDIESLKGPAFVAEEQGWPEGVEPFETAILASAVENVRSEVSGKEQSEDKHTSRSPGTPTGAVRTRERVGRTSRSQQRRRVRLKGRQTAEERSGTPPRVLQQQA